MTAAARDGDILVRRSDRTSGSPHSEQVYKLIQVGNNPLTAPVLIPVGSNFAANHYLEDSKHAD